MKFEISRTSAWDECPCDEAKEEMLTYVDYRSVATLDEGKSKHWFDDWYAGGINHREERGCIACDSLRKRTVWTIDIVDPLELYEAYGDLCIQRSEYKECYAHLEIYDSWRE